MQDQIEGESAISAALNIVDGERPVSDIGVEIQAHQVRSEIVGRQRLPSELASDIESANIPLHH